MTKKITEGDKAKAKKNEKERYYYCSTCSTKISDMGLKDPHSRECPNCGQANKFVPYPPTLKNIKKHKEKKIKKKTEVIPDKKTATTEKRKRAKTRKGVSLSGDEKREIEKEGKEGIEDLKKAINIFQNPDLLLKIKKELDKDHIGDDKAKLFLFACACSSRLSPNDRFSTAIIGESSEGKDNLWKTIFKHLPEKWFLDLTRTTTAALEDDIQEYNGVYVGEGNFEGGANAPIRDTVKQLSEDGIRTLKKDARTKHKKSRFEDQPRKTVIYSTTAHSDDEELTTRYCITSVHGSPNKYRQVNENTMAVAGNINLQIERYERKNESTWIQEGLKTLKTFDFIDIPYAPLLKVESRVARSQRDFKRFLNLIRSLAWICQYNRVSYIYKDYKILVVSAEDFYNAIEIGKEIFDQSLSGFEPRLQKVIDSYKKIIDKSPGEVKVDLEGAEYGLNWVDRSLIQKDLGIQKRDTIIKHVKQLTDMNIFTYFNKGNRTYVAFKFINSPSNSPSSYPLITVPQKKLYELIDNNEEQILSEVLDGKRTVKGLLASPNKKNKSNLLSLETHRPSINQKNVEKKHKLNIIEVLKQKMDGEKWTVSKNIEEDKQKTLNETGKKEVNNNKSLHGKISDVKKYVEDVILKGHDGVSYAALEDHFNEPFISKLIESQQLFKIPGTDCYKWGEK